ncbi:MULTISPECIES: MFS transporter [unclassified Corynebacterium]|uniref:MFS transporter n=1 Tax=unclassified Corynebacterium TaxID=2624378 RepID=UPI001C453168|nr:MULTISPECIES: MFS transporter [unclassified Corynebacterium]MBV7282411.1 MHS family MFS transporter [Corynebacterium sp. TAE3-ERU30]MBV7302243.1 MHS family MFS transporter [Corynebacterium sp. TAE3-ERU2]
MSRTEPTIADGDPQGPGTVEVDSREVGKIARAAFVGTVLEWYDFFLFGTASALVFNYLFFSNADDTTATLAAFATFGVGFFARPFGALLFGRIGDKLGRRPALILSIVVIGMATGLIGLLPTYDSIGLWAPVLLTVLRLGQGVAVGGEWGGATTMAIEHAPADKRGRYAALIQIGSPVGTLLSSGVFALVLLMPEETVDSWAWRIPFLLAFPFLGIALWIRLKVEESPVFRALAAEADNDAEEQGSLTELFGSYYRQLILAVSAALLGIGGFFVLTTYVMSYATTALGMARQDVVNATLLAAVCQIFINLIFGRLGEKIGPGRIIGWGSIATALLSYPVWMMIDTANVALLTLAVCIGLSVVTISYSVSGLLLSELFPAQLRYTGIAIGSNVAGTISGMLPFVAAWLNSSGEQPSAWPGMLILVVVALISAAGGFLGERHRVRDEVVLEATDAE